MSDKPPILMEPGGDGWIKLTCQLPFSQSVLYPPGRDHDAWADAWAWLEAGYGGFIISTLGVTSEMEQAKREQQVRNLEEMRAWHHFDTTRNT